MGIWAAVSSVALAVGPVAGGVLAGIDWRLIFWVNIPFVILGFLLVRWVAANVRDETAAPRIDWPGVLLLTAGLTAVVLGFAQAEDWGWDSPATIGTIAAGLMLLLVSLAGRAPGAEPDGRLLPLPQRALLRRQRRSLCSGRRVLGGDVLEPQYLQNILGYSPAEAGLLILPVTLPMVVLSPVIDRFVKALGPRAVMTTGMLLGVAGLLVMGRIDADTSYGTLLAGFLLFGIALGFVYAPMQTAAMAAMPATKAGIAAGVLAMNRILSGAVSLAITGSLFHTLLRERIQSEVESPKLSEGDAAELEGLVSGAASAQAKLAEQPASTATAIADAVDEAFAFALSNTLLFPAAVAAVGAGLCWWFVRTDDGEEAPTEPPAHHRHRGRFHL